MLRKDLRTSLLVAAIAAISAAADVMAVRPARCIRSYVLTAVRRLRFPLSRRMTGRSIARIVSRSIELNF